MTNPGQEDRSGVAGEEPEQDAELMPDRGVRGASWGDSCPGHRHRAGPWRQAIRRDWERRTSATTEVRRPDDPPPILRYIPSPIKVMRGLAPRWEFARCQLLGLFNQG